MAVDDASKPFLSAYDSGIAIAPYWDGTYNTVQSQLEVNQLVQLAGFQNEASTGFYAPDGTLIKDTNWYLYMNAVMAGTIPGSCIGILVERALWGRTT